MMEKAKMFKVKKKMKMADSAELQELALAANIGDYERQLVQLRAAHSATTDVKDRDDLLKLGDDMEQLICLSKDTLLSIKKKRLLDEVDRLASVEFTSKSEKPFTIEAVEQPKAAQVDDDFGTGSSTSAELDALLTSLEGTCCQAPFGFQWGQQDYHNAVVLHVEPHDSIESMDDVRVKVMFCNPTVDSMKSCPYFLDGNCRFSDDQCRFSHGHVVPFGQLRKFAKPDYGLLQRDAHCLAKYEDGLWYPAVVESVCDDDHRVTVKYKSYNSEATLELEEVIPLDMYLSSSDIEDDTCDSNSDDDSRIPTVTWVADASTSKVFGQWEKHTRGIGSKLMAKMGYVLGMGLGKNGEGRTEPVEAVLVPQGKSLDQIMELREKQEGRTQRGDIQKKRKRKGRMKRPAKVIADGYEKVAAEKVSVFDFINQRLVAQPGKSSNSINQLAKDSSQKQKLKEATGKNLNTKSLKVSEDIRRAEQELKRLQSAFARNQTSDKLVATQYSVKIFRQEQAIRDLKDYEKSIQGEQRSRTSDRKLTIF